MHFESADFDFATVRHPVIIAEVGVNHNCDATIARKMVDAAIDAGADVIKFQRFIAAIEISTFAEKAEYQQNSTGEAGSQLEMCQALELPDDELRAMKDYCAQRKMPFLCTAFEHDSVDFLVDELGLSSLKVPSPEITNIPLLQQIGGKQVGVLLSTGASTLAEVAVAIETLRDAGCPEIALMHCVSEYPTPPDQANLKAMHTLRDAFQLPAGFSDHTAGCEIAIAAAALGACVIEKHFTLDRNMPGPDHQASIEPDELAALVKGTRAAAAAVGTGVKKPMPCEMGNRPLIQKGLVCNVEHLTPGTVLTEEMIGVKRPWTPGGIAPADLQKVVGMQLTEEVSYDQPLSWSMFRANAKCL